MKEFVRTYLWHSVIYHAVIEVIFGVNKVKTWPNVDFRINLSYITAAVSTSDKLMGIGFANVLNLR